MRISELSPCKPGEPGAEAFDVSIAEFDKMLDMPEDLNQVLLESDVRHILGTNCMDMTWDIDPDGGVSDKPMQDCLSFRGGQQDDGGFYGIENMKLPVCHDGLESAMGRSFDDYYPDSSGALEQTTMGLHCTSSDFDYETSKSKDLEESKRTRKEIQKRYRERVKTKAKDVEEAITRAREELERLRFENQNLKSRNKAMEQQNEYTEDLISGKYGFDLKEKPKLKIEGGFFGQLDLAASQRGLVAARYMAQYLWTYFSAPSDRALQWLVKSMVKDRRNFFCRTFHFGFQRRLKRLLMEVCMQILQPLLFCMNGYFVVYLISSY